ncbi:heat-inducible transcriptional repressor HrcA [Lactovum miscens]|uniref:Heat-inducible transcription repressor HrcA n=1 Tax=Lactovum miscens TaxID=190387 RepID=A0A841C9F9_9LACT|nr:heat-inducible transcriptional repressor HrcA [Lactovum miscens]MBB5888358.1 heat-inducible transcriptional repressor [Lactovum miscens]
MITERQKEILNKIISMYADDHTPIASKALQKSIDASSATIRNDMKILEDLGLIQKEHTSSGRIPSVAGYQYFVENDLELEKISENDLFQVMKSFDGEFVRLSDLLETAAKTLSSLTGIPSFVLNIPQREQELRRFELVMLDNHSVLAIFTLSTGEVRTNQFILPKSLSEANLAQIKQIVNDRLLGKKILDIHYSLRTEIPQIVSHYFSATSDILKLFDVTFDGIFDEKIVSSGKENLLERYKILNKEKLIAQEIRLITDNDELRTVEFNDQNLFKDLTLISQKFLIPYRGLGTLALVGPIELDYRKIISIMDLTAKVLTMKLTDYYRYLDGNHYEIH